MVGGSPRLQRRQFTTNQARTAAPPNQMTTDNAVRLSVGHSMATSLPHITSLILKVLC